MAESALTEKIGGLPAIAWAGIAVGGFMALRFLRTGSLSAAPTAAPVDPNSLSDPWGTGAGGSSAGITTAASSTAVGTNLAWEQQCINWLIGQGADPVLSTAAITKYVDGTAFDTGTAGITEQALLKMALTKFGAPPETVQEPPTPIAKTPTTQGYVRMAGAQTVWQALSDNTLHGLGIAEYLKLGSPHFADVLPSDPIWRRNVVGGVGAPGATPDVLDGWNTPGAIGYNGGAQPSDSWLAQQAQGTN
jgi:hypothetical protein